ncbi:MAG TPA: PIN domain-containing protein [Patescibacteria group bacterium]|nr:PIN domain-containing protein [Patescibacteria group bacterium]
MAKLKQFQTALKKYRHLAIDSSIFIYQFEQHKTFEPLCSIVFEQLSHGKIVVSTSAITVAEVLTQPFQKKNIEVIALYKEVFHLLPHFSIIEVDYTVSLIAAQLRAEYAILLPDALHIAAAIHSGATAFITNDKQLKRVREIPIICLQDFV